MEEVSLVGFSHRNETDAAAGPHGHGSSHQALLPPQKANFVAPVSERGLCVGLSIGLGRYKLVCFEYKWYDSV